MMLQAAVSARSVRFDERAAELNLLRATVARLKVDVANLTLALAASERETAVWRQKWHVAALGNDRCPTIDRVIDAVCRHYGIGRTMIIGDRRSADIILPRHVAMYLCMQTTMRSYSVIARHFRRDHSTIIKACQKIAAMMRKNLQFAATVKALDELVRDAKG